MIENNNKLRSIYINLLSDLSENYTKTEIAKEMNISRVTLNKFIRENTDIQETINQNLRAQRHVMGNKGFKRLLNLVDTTKNPKLIQIALEIGELYTNNQIIINKYDSMKDHDVDKALINLLNKEKNKRKIE